MATIFDVKPDELIKKTAEELKKDISMPQWARFAKTSPGKERPPFKNDWYFQRAASILRKVYLLGPIGTNKLSVKYSVKKRRGHKPEEFRRGSRKIIRSILQQLEAKGLIKKEKKGAHHGRIITGKGKSFLDKLSTNILKENVK